uniref:cytochrome P450 n=2 Tax=Nocardiaceae TaxID=85025 RepID=UPI002030B3D4|nr:cytochrome P450 [Rhodococcus sp. MSC1_016]
MTLRHACGRWHRTSSQARKDSAMTTQIRTLEDLGLPYLDYEGREYQTDPASVVRAAREQIWLARSVRGYEVLSYGACSQLTLDKEHLDGPGSEYYRQQDASDLILQYASEGMLPLIPWVRHDPIRRVLQLAFSASRVRRLRPVMRACAEELLDAHALSGELDLVTDFNDIYPIEVVCRLLGVPVADIPLFKEWTVSLARLSHYPIDPFMGEIDRALRGLYEYFRDLVTLRRAKPADDFVTAIIEAESDAGNEERLSEGEMFGALVNLLFAGHDTTRLQFGSAVALLMQNRGQWDALVENPDLATAAIDESMRLQPSLHTILRTVTQDLVVDGIHFSPGTPIALNIFAANRDPAMFPDPDVFDPTRANAAKHLTFGRGHRLCLGHALARAEMTEALQVLATRFPDMHLVESSTFSGSSAATQGPERIRLRLI